GRVAPGATEPDWVFLRHTDFDGIGGFAELLRRRGADIPKLAQIKHPARASWFCLARALPKILKPRRRVQWGEIERGPVVISSPEQSPLAVAWHVFDEHSTTQIRRLCRKNAFTVNSF